MRRNKNEEVREKKKRQRQKTHLITNSNDNEYTITDQLLIWVLIVFVCVFCMWVTDIVVAATEKDIFKFIFASSF